MKNMISVSVKKPCSEKFSNFNTTKNGGFCSSCQKEVIDFTAMTTTEVLSFLSAKEQNTCGRFKNSQLKELKMVNYNTSNSLNYFTKSIATMGFSLLALCAVNNLNAQDNLGINTSQFQTEVQTSTTAEQDDTYTVKGVVMDEHNMPLAGVSVVLKGTNDGVSTDFDGKFEFSKPLKVDDVLVFSSIGYDTKHFTVTENKTSTIDVTITFESSDIELMGEIAIEGTYKPKRNIFQKIGSIFN
ncbi:carboxypeptidase-like regulatory domain-containing protein [Cellulophaga baltica]|uniref:carboxypeptidase-like regulatory domain-containing protein n=1 Tax=Cellulophaga TaxID=104264 RepID=UPI001C07DDEB|nr:MULTISPECIES: carboxypeptidase-like regulatory domain-containing protein [Cellulophaga]MBU2997111.1 carboxypeptidase-like regulatory domain-containing protein [Cellulophaga baltica]MDO6768509.1 carboxypeptidase-like regulatory domain-containing protein [Cellulophaga sp. 1_MG-2023]